MKNLKLTEQDLHNLYDLYYMMTPDKELEDTLKLNKMWEWFNDFFDRLEDVVVPEINEYEKKK